MLHASECVRAHMCVHVLVQESDDLVYLSGKSADQKTNQKKCKVPEEMTKKNINIKELVRGFHVVSEF